MKLKLKKFLLKLWWCYIFGDHKWTTPVEQGNLAPLPMEKGATSYDFQMALYKSSKMTCVRCDEEAEPSRRMFRKILADKYKKQQIINAPNT